jgi:hypothetical protein
MMADACREGCKQETFVQLSINCFNERTKANAPRRPDSEAELKPFSAAHPKGKFVSEHLNVMELFSCTTHSLFVTYRRTFQTAQTSDVIAAKLTDGGRLL